MPGDEAFLGKGLEHIVQTYVPYAGKRVVVVGGGDRAVDLALGLGEVASSVTFVQRRPEFRAHTHSLKLLKDSSIEVVTPATPMSVDPRATIDPGHSTEGVPT